MPRQQGADRQPSRLGRHHSACPISPKRTLKAATASVRWLVSPHQKSASSSLARVAWSSSLAALA
jgi:hypothetical protein